MPSTFDATLSVRIERLEGPEITDTAHILHWLCDDGTTLEASGQDVEFPVCSVHPDPEECTCHDIDSLYSLKIHAAS